jgi:hypothetical protein
LTRAKSIARLAAGALVASAAFGAADAAPRHTRHHADHRTLDQQAAASPTLALARCYGRFIAWRDELLDLMQQSGSYTDAAGATGRFDKLETQFIAVARHERGLSLRLKPTFAEKDFPPDLRAAFRTGLKESAARFRDGPYRSEQVDIIGETKVAPFLRMHDLESKADEAFEDLGAPCDRLAAQGSPAPGPR